MPVEVGVPIVVADVGKTSIRAEYRSPGMAPVGVEAPADGVVGGAAETGRVLAGLSRALDRLPAAARDVDVACVGVAGYLAHPDLHGLLERELGALLPTARLELTSDLVLAHAGALEGAAGTVLIVGTGAVALGIAADGGARMADGLGPLLGDEGSGAWIGRAGLTAALRAAQGRGPDTALRAAADEHFGISIEEIPGFLLRRDHPVRDVAGFAPVVIREWQSGCATAAAIVETAAVHLAETAAAAAAAPGPSAPIALIGSLMLDQGFREVVIGEITAQLPGAPVVEPIGNALDGAAFLAAAPAGREWLAALRLGTSSS
jgi:N-acetylglucosamine kinase-like BadF-type ATPase